MAKKKVNKAIEVLKLALGRKVVSYQVTFAKAFGSINAAVFLSQAYFWQYEADYIEYKIVEGQQFFDKTIAEWHNATGLSEEQQKAARALLKKHNIIKEKKIGSPAKLCYSIDTDALVAVIYRYTETGQCLAVDNRHKQRQYTRASGGKFRLHEAVIYGDINKEETFETKEREEKESTPAPEIKEETAPEKPEPEIPAHMLEALKADVTESKKVPTPAPQKKPFFSVRDSPKAETASQLFSALQDFYASREEEWKDGVLGFAKGGMYSEAQREEIIKKFCAHTIKNNGGGNTYGMLNGDLQNWFLRQKDFQVNYPAAAASSTATPTPSRGAIPAGTKTYGA